MQTTSNSFHKLTNSTHAAHFTTVFQQTKDSQYFAPMTCLHVWSHSAPYLESYFLIKALLKVLNFIIPKPSTLIGAQILSQFSNNYLCNRIGSPQLGMTWQLQVNKPVQIAFLDLCLVPILICKLRSQSLNVSFVFAFSWFWILFSTLVFLLITLSDGKLT